MADILHRVGVQNATPQAVTDKITTVDGLVEFMHHCSTKLGSFLMSPKSLVETAVGAPAPRDVQVGD